MRLEKLRWWAWKNLCRLPNVCPANAHGALIWRTNNDPRIDWMCRQDCERVGACWCGKLRAGGSDEETK